MVWRVVGLAALAAVITCTSAVAQPVRDAVYRGTLICDKLPFTTAKMREAIDVTINRGTVRYSHVVRLRETPEPVVERDPAGGRAPKTPASVLPPATRVVGRDGGIHLARHRYAVGRWLRRRDRRDRRGDALVEIFHRGVLIVSHVARHQAGAAIVNRKPVNTVTRPPRRRNRCASPAGGTGRTADP